MKLIIAGKRDFYPSLEFITSAIKMLGITDIEEVVSGTARGVDTEGEHWALEYGVDVEEFPADWDKHGKAAGHIRNRQMAKYADELLVIWDGESKGSGGMKEIMLKLDKPVYEVILKEYNNE